MLNNQLGVTVDDADPRIIWNISGEKVD